MRGQHGGVVDDHPIELLKHSPATTTYLTYPVTTTKKSIIFQIFLR